jgi:hypothetical protein
MIAILLPFVAAPAAQGASETVWQYGVADKANPKGVVASRDLKKLTLGIYPDPDLGEDRFQFFIDMGGKVATSDLSDTSYVELLLDTNLDKISDFSIKFVNKPDANYAHGHVVLDSMGQAVADCAPYIWANETSFATSFNKDCISPKSEINVSLKATSDGTNFDLLPDNSAWQKFKTKYMQVATCNASAKSKKVTYSGTTYICLKTGSKYAWADYGPIAAKSAKWLTEKAYYLCNLGGKYGVTLEDGGKTLTLDGVYKYFISEKDYKCVATALAMPASAEKRIGFTRALDGMQEARWGQINAFWNYHPDSGLNITFSYN